MRAIVRRPSRSLGVEGDAEVDIGPEEQHEEQEDLDDEPGHRIDDAGRDGGGRVDAEPLEEPDVDGDAGRGAGDGEVHVADRELHSSSAGRAGAVGRSHPSCSPPTGIRGSWASTSANASHHQLASARASTNDSRSMSPKTLMSANAANARRATLSSEPHVTRRSLMSGCSSAPSVLASRVRTSSSSILRSAELGAEQRRHRRLLEERQHGDDRVVAERPGDGDAAILAEQQDRQREHLGPIRSPRRRARRPPWPTRGRRGRATRRA